MAKIFLSYRRQESTGVAGRIYDRLRSHFGDAGVFMDVHSIPFGKDFRKYIAAEIEQCDVMVVVIGRNWAGEAGTSRRLDDAQDFVPAYRMGETPEGRLSNVGFRVAAVQE